MDSILDKATSGPFWLRDFTVARCVTDAIHLGSQKLNFYALHAFVVMPNHVHLLITPKVPLSRVTNGLKGVTARNANAILRRTGQHFWQDESFDHLGPQPRPIRPHPRLHRVQPRHRRPCQKSQSLALVQRQPN